MTAPRVLIADQLSPAAVAIFKERGIATDVKVGLAKEELEKIIKDYDGLAVRSATKVTEKIIAAASQAQGGRPRRHRRRQHRRQGRHRQGHHRHEHALRQFHHHGRARHLADDGAGAPDPGGRPLHPGRQVGEVEVPGRRAVRQDAGRDRLRQHRLDRRRPRHRPEDEGDRLRSVPVAGAGHGAGRGEGRARRAAAPRRFHHPAHAAHRQDPQHHRCGRARARPRRACASSTARAAAWSTSGRWPRR